MTRDEAIARLIEHEAELKRLGVQSLYLFGSTARNEATEESDVDLFFDHERGMMGLFQLLDIKHRVEAVLGTNVDFITRNSLHRMLRPRIEASAVKVF